MGEFAESSAGDEEVDAIFRRGDLVTDDEDAEVKQDSEISLSGSPPTSFLKKGHESTKSLQRVGSPGSSSGPTGPAVALSNTIPPRDEEFPSGTLRAPTDLLVGLEPRVKGCCC